MTMKSRMSGRIQWEYVGWLLALVGALMALYGQPAEAHAASHPFDAANHALIASGQDVAEEHANRGA